jgi:hypothetical protein
LPKIDLIGRLSTSARFPGIAKRTLAGGRLPQRGARSAALRPGFERRPNGTPSAYQGSRAELPPAPAYFRNRLKPEPIFRSKERVTSAKVLA